MGTFLEPKSELHLRILIMITLTSALIVYFSRMRKKSPQLKKRRYIVNLLDLESTALTLRRLPSITTMTYYKGTPPIDHLRARAADILIANPWLDGRLIWNDSRVCLTFDDVQDKPCARKRATQLVEVRQFV